MLKTEAQDFFDREIAARWPKWDPSGAVVSDWVRNLLPWSWDDARRGLLNYVDSAKTFNPRLPEFRSHLRGLGPSQSREESGPPEPYLFVQNTDSGAYKAVYALSGRKLTTDREALLAAARNAKDRCEQCYGGLWRVVESTWGKMLDEKRAIEADEGHPF